MNVKRLAASAADTNPTLVSAGPGRVFKLTGYNAKASVVYLKLYDKSSAPTVGTTVPRYVFPLKASDRFDIDFGEVAGIDFGAGIGFGLTTDAADNGTTAVSANDIVGLAVFWR